MLQVNVEARYTAEDVLSHPWVTVNVCGRVLWCICLFFFNIMELDNAYTHTLHTL